MPGGVLGRERELEAAARALEQLERGPAALAIEGDPGIGKTTLWRTTCSLGAERNYRVLSVRPAEPERSLAFAGLADLLGGIDGRTFEGLPPQQRRALDAALLRGDEDGPPSDPRAVFAGALAVLSALAAETPVVVAVDDVQWLDPPSGSALRFIARRLGERRVGILVASRPANGVGADGLLAALPEETTTRIRLGPLTLAATYLLLKERVRAFPRPTLLRIQQASGGNPFFALEIARAIGSTEPSPDEPLPVPEDVGALIRRRIERMPRATQDALLRAAALSQPIAALFGDSLEPARTGGLVEALPHGRVAFTHPLYAGAVYEAASQEERRRTHRELAELVPDIEERAHHLGLATADPDEQVAGELDRAAERARSRGAPEMAAELQERALAVTPPSDRHLLQRRMLAAADHYVHAGALARARSLASSALERSDDPLERAGALRLLAHARYREKSVPEAIELLQAAAREAGDDPALRTQIEMDLMYLFVQISVDHEVAQPHADALVGYAERLADPAQLAEALAVVTMFDFLLGRGLDEVRLARALDLEDPDHRGPAEFRPTLIAGFLAFYTGRFEQARSLLYPLLARLRDRGEEGELPMLLHTLSWLECWAGDLAAAGRLADEGLEAALLTESESLTALCQGVAALVDAHAGRVDSCRERIGIALPLIERAGYGLAGMWTFSTLGFLELSSGDPAAAQRALEPLTRFVEARGLVEPIRAFFLPDAIEAMVALGELPRAERLTEMLSECGRGTDRPWALATSFRCKALLLAARGEFPAALVEIVQALEEHERLPMPLELGRTLLVKGQIERRSKQKAAARDAFDRALAIFSEVGARLWSEKARAELARTSPRHGAPTELTPSERRVAELVASGLRNREVAARLFMSPKTVEANLARTYRKLGIRSRAELGARLGAPGATART